MRGQTQKGSTTMGWERGYYYPLERRSAAGLLREYIGRGPLARTGCTDGRPPSEPNAKQNRKARRAEQAEVGRPLDAPLDRPGCSWADLLARAALLAAGYRPAQSAANGGNDVLTTQQMNLRRRMNLRSRRNIFFQVVERAQSGDESTLPDLRQLLSNRGNVDLLGGDLARQAERSLINNAGRRQPGFCPGKRSCAKLELMRDGPGPVPTRRR